MSRDEVLVSYRATRDRDAPSKVAAPDNCASIWPKPPIFIPLDLEPEVRRAVDLPFLLVRRLVETERKTGPLDKNDMMRAPVKKQAIYHGSIWRALE